MEDACVRGVGVAYGIDFVGEGVGFEVAGDGDGVIVWVGEDDVCVCYVGFLVLV